MSYFFQKMLAEKARLAKHPGHDDQQVHDPRGGGGEEIPQSSIDRATSIAGHMGTDSGKIKSALERSGKFDSGHLDKLVATVVYSNKQADAAGEKESKRAPRKSKPAGYSGGPFMPNDG